MFYHVIFYPFSVMVRCVREKAYVRPCISGDVVMYAVVKGDIFDFIGLERTNNGIVLCESCL